MRRALLAPLLLFLACSGPTVRPSRGDTILISIVGTNDLHGHLRALPLLGGHLANLRRAREEDGGAVLLLDGGDMFQGTLESNLEEGASVVRAYEALGYDAVAIGNHEFDYGPIGVRATASAPGDDPRGALRARMLEASFPFLSANLLARATGERAEIGAASVVIERAGVRIGVIGASTESTPSTTIAANVADLVMRPIAEAIAEEAAALRARGATVVVVVAHAGGDCEAFDDPRDLASCDPSDEIFEVASGLPPGAVDAIVGGHTHQGVAHRVNGIAIIEAYSYGVALGRIDLVVDRRTGRVREPRIHPPRRLCGAEGGWVEGPIEQCAPLPYEGAAVLLDRRVADVIAPAVARAGALRERVLGPTLAGAFPEDRGSECALGNLFTDLMMRARPGADAAIINGGGLRATLPAGPLRYGALYEAFPFDNRFATVRMTGAELAGIFATSLARDGSFMSVSGITVRARCEGDALRVSLARPDGSPIAEGDPVTVLASDFLATGGDGAFESARGREGAITLEEDPPIREAMADVLSTMDETLAPVRFHDPARPRIVYPGPRPVRCED